MAELAPLALAVGPPSEGATGLTVGGVVLPGCPLATPVPVLVPVPFLTSVLVGALPSVPNVAPRDTPEVAAN